MAIPTMLKSLLVSGVFLASLPCYSLSSDCLTVSPSIVSRRADAIGVVSVSSLSSDPGVTGTSLQDGSANIDRFLNQVQEAATSGAYPSDADLAPWNKSSFVPDCLPPLDGSGDRPADSGNNSEKVSPNPPVERVLANTKPADRNREIYYRNKLELAFDLGTFPINIPFPFDFIEGDSYIQHPIRYTLVPIIASLRWHMSNIGGPWIFRGNWDLTSSGSFTWIPSGPETRFISYDMGIRRNFVPRNRNFDPYFDIRLGVGQINAKGPKGVPYAQGEDWPEFTMNMGSGLRYNFSPQFAFTAGLNYMHISNMDLSEHAPTATDPHWGATNYGINVYGPQLGIDIQLRRHSHPE
jgi:hypothetical protein